MVLQPAIGPLMWDGGIVPFTFSIASLKGNGGYIEVQWSACDVEYKSKTDMSCLNERTS